jgi:hypothetical protein
MSRRNADKSCCILRMNADADVTGTHLICSQLTFHAACAICQQSTYYLSNLIAIPISE